uniref:Uncharacterized protein n=1 Tax=Steinernema glaseri TaxID=37863 RepID=A0A1I8AVZ9_9BILA
MRFPPPIPPSSFLVPPRALLMNKTSKTSASPTGRPLTTFLLSALSNELRRIALTLRLLSHILATFSPNPIERSIHADDAAWRLPSAPLVPVRLGASVQGPHRPSGADIPDHCQLLPEPDPRASTRAGEGGGHRAGHRRALRAQQQLHRRSVVLRRVERPKTGLRSPRQMSCEPLVRRRLREGGYEYTG